MTAPKLRQTPLKRKSPMIRPTLAAVAGRFANDRPRGSVPGISPMQAKTELLSGLTVALALVPEAVAFAFVAGVQPLVGLYAAFIVGLITAFQGVSSASEAAKQEILASGISVAMLTTAFGLIVAIPCLAGFYILNNRGDFVIDQLEEKALSLFNMLSSLKQERSVS